MRRLRVVIGCSFAGQRCHRAIPEPCRKKGLSDFMHKPINSLKPMETTTDARSGNGTNARFPQQTDWSGIVIAGGPASSPEAREALNRLCQMYWPPLYAYIRFKGNKPFSRIWSLSRARSFMGNWETASK